MVTWNACELGSILIDVNFTCLRCVCVCAWGYVGIGVHQLWGWIFKVESNVHECTNFTLYWPITRKPSSAVSLSSASWATLMHLISTEWFCRFFRKLKMCTSLFLLCWSIAYQKELSKTNGTEGEGKVVRASCQEIRKLRQNVTQYTDRETPWGNIVWKSECTGSDDSVHHYS